ncbi:MAG: alpha/beta fold hydrolase [Bacteroidales bacterium]|nr:alpha/beta fold hydrolase [Bacteroidales bacterium]
MEQHKIIEFEGRSIHYRDEGKDNRNTLVLLHGFMQNLDVWTSYVLTYMHSMRVITIDLPGHGQSSTYCDTHTMDFMARTVKAVLTDAAVQQCVMVGHSMGGYVALAFARENPYWLRGLGLINSHALADTEAHRNYRAEVCQLVATNRPSYIVSSIPTLFSEYNHRALSVDIKDLQDQCLDTASVESIVAAQQGMAQRKNSIDILSRLEIPILFIYGKDDNRIPLEIALSQAMVPHHAEIMVLEHVGHMAFMEARDYVKPRLKSFVDNCYL